MINITPRARQITEEMWDSKCPECNIGNNQMIGGKFYVIKKIWDGFAKKVVRYPSIEYQHRPITTVGHLCDKHSK